ncbi:MAG: NADH:flavin oxidoreductase [Promethearchaeota archaeon]
MELKTLYSPEKIANIQIKNRIVRSATFMASSEKYGYVGENLININSKLASGGTGLIISGYTAVDPGGTASPYQECIYNDSFIPGQKKLVKAVHEYPDVKFALQIAHTGRLGYHPKYPTVAPSPIPVKETGIIPRELTSEEIEELVQKFIDSGRRGYECGYDMVQLHAAHGYFLSNFISPYTNKRTDEYGGSIENRARIIINIYNGLRDELGKDFPIMIKLQIDDFIPNGLQFEEGIKFAKLFSEIGFDAIEPSGGSEETRVLTKKSYPSLIIKSSDDENYFLPYAKKIKPLMKNCKLILVGGIRDPLQANKIIQDKNTDFISLCRPLIYEPDLPNRWKAGDHSPAKCISCNNCFPRFRDGTVYCVTKNQLKKKKK